MTLIPFVANADFVGNALGDSFRHLAAEQFAGRYVNDEANWLRRLLAVRDRCLLALDAVRAGLVLKGQHYGGVRSVPIKQIEGSESRHCDYTSDFRPRRVHSRSRWIGIAAARLAGAELPPVELIQIGHRYFVRDGHHRISVARAQGQLNIDAEITVWEV